MKIKSTIFNLVITLLVVNFSCNWEPKIKFDEMSHNFGEVNQQVTLSHTFYFTNAGQATLIIEKVKAGWGCTGVLLSKKDIPAGGKGEIEVTLKTGTRVGKLKKTIYVYTNDEAMKKAKLTVAATVSEKLIPDLRKYDNHFFSMLDVLDQIISISTVIPH